MSFEFFQSANDCEITVISAWYETFVGGGEIVSKKIGHWLDFRIVNSEYESVY